MSLTKRAAPPPQTKWSLLLDADLCGLVAGSLAATLAAVAVRASAFTISVHWRSAR
jgi:hypothetical protein